MKIKEKFIIFLKKVLTNEVVNDIIVKRFALHHFFDFGRRNMFEKNLEIGYLLDFYGELLPERKRSVMDMYYNEDFSLAEIAAEIDISRQGVRDIIKKCEDELLFFEEKLGLAKKMKAVETSASELLEISSELSLPTEVNEKIAELLRTVKL